MSECTYLTKHDYFLILLEAYFLQNCFQLANGAKALTVDALYAVHSKNRIIVVTTYKHFQNYLWCPKVKIQNERFTIILLFKFLIYYLEVFVLSFTNHCNEIDSSNWVGIISDNNFAEQSK